MTGLMFLKAHYTPEEAASLLNLLDELRESLWNHYREEIIEYCGQQCSQYPEGSAPLIFEDDIIPF